jgi:threonine/homoserine/homoserine lactone efflux protein
MNTDTIILYTVVSFFYIISPGPAVFLALANGMGCNLKAVILSSFGNVIGLFLLSSISIIGLGALILTSSTLFIIVKIIGAAYLIYLGVKQFRISKDISSPTKNVKGKVKRLGLSYFSEGFFLAATNPKPVLFFIAIFPQFLNIELSLVPQFFTLTIIFMIISFSTLISYGYLARSAKNIFSSKVGMKWFHRITGGLFIGMGIGLLQLRNASS